MRLQSQSTFCPLGGGLRYAGPLDCFWQSPRAGGPAELYRGVSAPLLGAVVETSSLFFSYQLAQRVLEVVLYPADAASLSAGGRPGEGIALPLWTPATARTASGALTSLVLTPIELVKCQMQAPLDGGGSGNGSGTIWRSPLSVIASVYRHYGVFGL